MRFVSLFSGIGGIDLGLERAGMECVAQVENDPWCNQILEKHWPAVPRWEDIHDLDPKELPDHDLIAGGFPCQDISTANSRTPRAALDGERSGLWWKFDRVVAACRPRRVLVENVATNWRSWVPTVQRRLAIHGYWTAPLVLYAGSVGAPHQRGRVFVVGDTDSDGESTGAIHEEVARLSPASRDSGHWRLPPPEPLRMDDGVSHGMDRLRGLGNAVVPQVAELVGRMIMETSR